MSAERVYKGESKNGNLQEAIAVALEHLEAELGEGGVSDASASWVISKISGTYGGLVGIKSVNAELTATRLPPWDN